MKKILLFVLVSLLVLTACSTARQKLTPQGNLYLKSANVYYQQQNVEKAQDYYTKVLDTNPEYVIALKRIADINLYNATQMPDKSVEFNKNAYVKYDETLSVMAKFTDLSEDEKTLKRDATKKKEAAWVRIFNFGKQQFMEQKYTESLKTFQALYALDKTRVEALKLMVSIYQEMQSKDPDQKDAEDNVGLYLTKILEITPNDTDMIKMLGSHFYTKKDYANAVIYFNKTKAIAPRDYNNLLLLASSYYNLKEHRKALDELKQVLIINPDNIDAMYDARTNANEIPDIEETIFYSKLLVDFERTPENSDNIAFLVMKLNEAKRYAEAMPYAEKWFDMDTSSSNVASICLIIAREIGNKELISKYDNILKSMN